MALFQGTEVTQVVTPDDVRKNTGVTPDDLFLKSSDPEVELNNLITSWINQIASHIKVRLGYEVDPAGDAFHAIRGILIGNVSNVVTFAIQQRTSPVVQLGDYAVNIIQSSRVVENLSKELEPFYGLGAGDGSAGTGGWSYVFWSTQDDTTETTSG